MFLCLFFFLHYLFPKPLVKLIYLHQLSSNMSEADIGRWAEILVLPHNFIDVSALTAILGNPIQPFPALVNEVIPTTSTKRDSTSAHSH